MAVAFLDSNVLIAFASQRDANHGPATEIVRGIDAEDLPTARVTNYVLAEVLNFFHERRGHEVAVELHERLKRGSSFDLLHATKADYHRADDLFTTYDTLSFVDATIIATMERQDVSYVYGFDDDLDAVDGITRLDTATNPFI
jgi:predicted nucleic acid-binding protein